MFDLFSQGKSPIPRTGSCQAIYEWAKATGRVSAEPKPGYLFLYVNDDDHAHHVGIVTNSHPLTGIAGNTSSDGKSSNGDGVYEHEISAHVFVRVLED